ncbi:YceI family protein [Streptomyces sp. NPDC005970]|uniref:YceI family protein n=1 Tax=Streptomyces sp. NPDC005970 TaxID=3156723 RepID=UPI00340ED6D7
MSEPAAATPPSAVQPGSWILDPARTRVRIQHKTMWGMVTVKGGFTNVDGEAETLPDGSASGTLTIDAASVDTGHAKRDAHLRSADFFDTDRHSTLVFTAHRAAPDPQGAVEVSGELTVRGTTRPLSFTATGPGATADEVTLAAELIVDPADFGLTWNRLGMMKGHTTVTVEALFTRGRA